MATKRLKRPRDPVQLGKLIGDILTGQIEDSVENGRSLKAIERGRLGGLKGGNARAAQLTPEQKAAIAKKAAKARWAHKK
jgi:hypothetical protein